MVKQYMFLSAALIAGLSSATVYADVPFSRKVAHANSKLPLQVDKNITMEKITYEGDELTYHVVLLYEELKGEVPLELLKAMASALKPVACNMAKEVKGAETLKEITFSFKAGTTPAGGVTFTPEDCS